MKNKDQKQKQIRMAVTGVFCLFIFALSVANLFAPKKDFSENENRMLSPFPSLSARNILLGDFDTEFETWFADHFIGRDDWIMRKASLRTDFGAIENNGVWLCRDHRLVSQFLTCDYENVEKNISYLQEFSEENDMTLNILLVPTAAYGEKKYLPLAAANVDEKALLERIGESLGNQNFIDISDDLLSIDDAYFRTDHHWNEKGALIAYQVICKEVLGRKPENFTYEDVSDSFRGSMYSRSGAFWTPADSIYRIIPEYDIPVTVTFEDGRVMDTMFVDEHLQEKDQYTYYLDGNHGYVNIKTGNANGRKAIVVKDSFAHILLPYLAQEYEEVEVFDLRYYTESISEHIDEENREKTDIYVIYGLDTFCSDNNLSIFW